MSATTKAPVVAINTNRIIDGSSTPEQLMEALPRLQEFALKAQTLTKTLDEEAQKRFAK
jgi:hypothetical protein